MKKKTILFFPVEIGLAHVTRSLAIADELKDRGHTVIVAAGKRKAEFVRTTGLECIEIANYFRKDDDLLIEKFTDLAFDLPFAKDEEMIIKKVKPDVAVVDFRITAIPGCIKYSIPTVWITNGDGLPFPVELPLRPPFNVIANLTVNFMKQIALKKLAQLTKMLGKETTVSEIVKNLTYILPENRHYLKVRGHYQDVLHYVGQIEWRGFNHYKNLWLEDMKPNGRTVYISFGGTGFDQKKLIELSVRFVKADFRVIVSTGTIADPMDFPTIKNLFVSRYLSGQLACQKADVVVCHGGIGTLSQAVVAGKPIVAIPFNPDQLLHVLRFQELGLAKLAVDFKLRLMTGFLKFDWHGFQRAGSLTSVDHVVKTTELVLAQKEKYRKAIERYGEWFKEKKGAEEAARLIEKL